MAEVQRTLTPKEYEGWKREEEIKNAADDEPKTVPLGESSEKKGEFDLLNAADNKLVKKYRPKFLAKGGEHIIYEIPGHPESVVKVETWSLKKIQEENVRRGLPPDAMDPEMLLKTQEYLDLQRGRHKKLTEHFGREHVLPLKQYLLKVPVTEKFVRQAHQGYAPKDAEQVKEAWAVVRVQKRAPEFEDPEHMSITAGYAESKVMGGDREIMKQYERVRAALVLGDPKARYSTQDFHAMLPPKTAQMLRQAKKDPGLGAALRDFVGRAMDYAEDTGEILDLAGSENVTLFQEEGTWRYRLVDALYPGAGAPDQLNRETFLRTVNGIAADLGLKRRLSSEDIKKNE